MTPRFSQNLRKTTASPLIRRLTFSLIAVILAGLGVVLFLWNDQPWHRLSNGGEVRLEKIEYTDELTISSPGLELYELHEIQFPFGRMTGVKTGKSTRAHPIGRSRRRTALSKALPVSLGSFGGSTVFFAASPAIPPVETPNSTQMTATGFMARP